MCGRFTLSTAADILQTLFEIDAGPMPELPARYNIAPSQDVAIVRPAGGGREMVLVRWGLVPFWAKDADIGSRLINARLETAAQKPAFRAAFARRRCLVPADGFYEWAKEDGKQPYLFRLGSGQAFGLAGLWDRWRSDDGQAVESCTILTTNADEVVARVHPRMPVILDPGSYAEWLSGSPLSDDDTRAWTLAGEREPLVAHKVSRRVNSPAADDPELVAPIG